MRRSVILAMFVLVGCGEAEDSDQYQAGYDEAWAEAAEQIQQLEAEKAEMLSAIEDAQMAISNAQTSAEEAHTAAVNASSEADRLTYEELEYVVYDVTSAVDDAVTEASEVSTDLLSVEMALSDY